MQGKGIQMAKSLWKDVEWLERYAKSDENFDLLRKTQISQGRLDRFP